MSKQAKSKIASRVEEFVEELMIPIDPPSPSEQRQLRQLADELCDKLTHEVAFLNREAKKRKIPRRVRAMHSNAVKAMRRTLERRVRDILGEMSEKYRSPHAWVFIPQALGALRSVFSYRSRMTNQRVRMDERSIISQVARTLQPHAAPDVSKDPFYKPCLSGMKSELAVPIVSVGPRAERTLLGVANFESHELGNFTQDMEHPAEIDARELALPLICLKSAELGDLARWPFDPGNSGWTTDGLLYRLCCGFTSALEHENPDTDLSATVWLAEWEEKLLWARAPAGYDYEYRREPLEGDTVTWSGATARYGTVIRTTPDDPRFKDKEKAKKMGMVRLLTTPIFDDPVAERSLGALNVCQFRTDGPETTEDRDALPSDDTVVAFANLVGEATAELERVREEAACAYLDWKMEASRLATEVSQVPAAQFHNLKEVLRECFAADGCSIFLPDEKDEFLDLVSSTGIRGERLEQHEGRWVVRRTEPTRYPLRDPTNPSVMQFLFDHPGMAVVLNRVSDISGRQQLQEQGLPIKIYPVGMEHINPDTEERRFLGVCIRTQSRTSIVVRLVRSTENPPFSIADARLLEALGGLCSRSAYWQVPSSNRIENDENMLKDVIEEEEDAAVFTI